MSTISTVERAFQLAGSGECHSIMDIKRRLVLEGYVQVELHLGGALIKKQLRQAMPSLVAVSTAQE